MHEPGDDATTLDFILMAAILSISANLALSPLMVVSTDAVKLTDTLRPHHFTLCYGILVLMGILVTASAFGEPAITALLDKCTEALNKKGIQCKPEKTPRYSPQSISRVATMQSLLAGPQQNSTKVRAGLG